MVQLGRKVGARTGSDLPPFIKASDLDAGNPWRKVVLTSISPAKTKIKKTDFWWVVFRDVDGKWVHRQAYFFESKLTQIFAVFGIYDGIDDTAEVEGRELWINLAKDDQGDKGVFVKVAGYSADDPRSGTSIEVPF